MSVSLYLGLPGDGKSMSGMRKVETVLTQGNRYVITNLPIEMGELQSYLTKQHGHDYNCKDRVVLLEQERVRKFWLARAHGWRLLDLPDEAWSQNQFPSLQKVYRWVPKEFGETRQELTEMSVVEVLALVRDGEVEVGDLGKLDLSACYIIDEAQNFWPARSYQSTPKGLLFYLSQHRHVGDDCVFITQKESQVEKVVRNLVMEFWVFKNLGQRKRLGFRLPGVFGYTCFAEPPSAQGAQYQSIGTFRMDVKGLASCYRTADGVGVGGPTMEADTGRKKAGLSWKWAVLILLVLVALAAMLPGGIAKGLEWALLGGNRMTNVAAGVMAVWPTNAPAPVPLVLPSSVAVAKSVEPEKARETLRRFPDAREFHGQTPRRLGDLVAAQSGGPVTYPVSTNVFITATMTGVGGWYVTLTDGRILEPGEYDREMTVDGRIRCIKTRSPAVIYDWAPLSRVASK